MTTVSFSFTVKANEFFKGEATLTGEASGSYTAPRVTITEVKGEAYVTAMDAGEDDTLLTVENALDFWAVCDLARDAAGDELAKLY